MDKVGNRIRSKNDSERTIVRFFLFREKVDFSPEKSPHDRPSTGRPPSGQPEGTRPSWGWGTSRVFLCTWGSSLPHHCRIVLLSPWGGPGASWLPSTGDFPLRTFMHNQGCQTIPRIGTPLPGYVPSSSPSSVVMRSRPPYFLLTSLVERWSMTCRVFFLFRVADTIIGSYHAIRLLRDKADKVCQDPHSEEATHGG